MNEPAFYICVPAYPKMDGTVFGKCQLCAQKVQYKPGGPELAEMHHGRSVTMICYACAKREIPIAMLATKH